MNEEKFRIESDLWVNFRFRQMLTMVFRHSEL